MGRTEKAALTKQLLLDAAKRLFSKFGFERVGTRDIGSEAGRPFTSIYKDFVDKDGIWKAAMGCDAPDPAAFARFVRGAKTLGEAQVAADAFLLQWRGENRGGAVWKLPANVQAAE
jgi:AcrR family transcriptional regulator